MFLFSGTFFPIEPLPGPLQLLAEILPLHHGVALARHLCLGDQADRSDQLVHVVVLVAYVVVGTVGLPRDLPPDAGEVCHDRRAPDRAAAPGRDPRRSRLVERNVMVYRRTWIVLVSGFFEPVFYLLAIGFGLGGLVGPVVLPGGQTVPYAVFVAPGLLASSAMNGAIYDSTFNIFFKLRYAKTYDAMLSTPMAVPDVAVGEIAWALIRGTLYAIGFLVAMAAARADRLAAGRS